MSVTVVLLVLGLLFTLVGVCVRLIYKGEGGTVSNLTSALGGARQVVQLLVSEICPIATPAVNGLFDTGIFFYGSRVVLIDGFRVLYGGVISGAKALISVVRNWNELLPSCFKRNRRKSKKMHISNPFIYASTLPASTAASSVTVRNSTGMTAVVHPSITAPARVMTSDEANASILITIDITIASTPVITAFEVAADSPDTDVVRLQANANGLAVDFDIGSPEADVEDPEIDVAEDGLEVAALSRLAELIAPSTDILSIEDSEEDMAVAVAL